MQLVTSMQEQKQLLEFLLKQNFQFHVTANLNQLMSSYSYGKGKLKIWHAAIDKRLHGHKFYDLPDEDRVFFIAVPEWGTSGLNLHWHLLVRVPTESKAKFLEHAPTLWKKFVPPGDMLVQEIPAADQEKVAGYVLKDISKLSNWEHVILSPEFCTR